MTNGRFAWGEARYDICVRCGTPLSGENRNILSLTRPCDGTVVAAGGLCNGCADDMVDKIDSEIDDEWSFRIDFGKTDISKPF